ncbi:hypothetical protein [Magnetospirillum sulfuroxidans]|uniref:EF-hand domain-containing protein n=1 Tax=Magnetospirillum sulfuroxidans TaxID=611300 RepID=A0ABS5IGE4_9PROT|nr:hypothetical protein [Magnetospirillum sulfuroxidans]MBR9973464.1 hypothetical protein [Magnetospirillum sulfuroxidans]
MTVPALPHAWRFFRAGGFDQVRIETGADLLALDQLDQKLWVALACPTTGIEFDARALDVLDIDHDGRIRANEILAAVRWLRLVLKNGDELVLPGSSLNLRSINDDSVEGARILASARRLLSDLGRAEAEIIDLEDTRDSGRLFAQARFNGDGVIPVEVTEDADLRAVITDIMTCEGSEEDRSGAPGIGQDKIDNFFAQIGAYGDWLDTGSDVAVSPQAGAALEALRDKIDGFFLRCRMAVYSDAAAQTVNPAVEIFQPLIGANAVETAAALVPLPLASVYPQADLPLLRGVNPAWEGAMANFRRLVANDRLSLSESEWTELKARFVSHGHWLAKKPETRVERLGDERIRALCQSDAQAALSELVAQDKLFESEADAIDALEKLLVLRTHLFRLVNNFVSFKEFYARQDYAVFQAGSLYLDGRSADLCLSVADAAKHAAVATLSRIYLVYCQCTRRGADEKMTIMAGFTAGDSDQLMIGRNGVFYDRQGRDWDAAIIKIVEHPISLRQAFWSPYKQLSRFIGAQLEKLAAAKAKAVETDLQTKVASKVVVPATAAAPAKDGFDAGKFAGIFAALGLAVGAIGTAIASVVTGFLHLSWWQMPVALVGLVMVVSGPSMLIAYMKLRHRNLAPILDAAGWAVNARATINIPFGSSLTAVAHLPEGAERSLVDPFAEKRRPWGEYAMLLALIAGGFVAAWRFGLFDRFIP